MLVILNTSIYEVCLEETEPVSYTHLDVYKRQYHTLAGLFQLSWKLALHPLSSAT